MNACTADELSVLKDTFRLLFERSILETDDKIQLSIEKVGQQTTTCSKASRYSR